MVKVHVDQLGNTLQSKQYERIISLVPSQTELLYDLGLAERVVGITKFCIHPEVWFKSKKRIGGTKTVDIQKVAELKPDLIIGNKEENTKEDIEALSKIAPIWMSDIYTLQDSLDMTIRLGNLLNLSKKAQEISAQIEKNFSYINKFEGNKSCLYLIWRKPYMAAGSNTFIHNMLSKQLGFRNILENEGRYPIVDLYSIKEVPDFILLSSEPYPFSQKHIQEIKDVFPHSKVVLVNGEYFSWYGSRLLKSPIYFNEFVKEISAY